MKAVVDTNVIAYYVLGAQGFADEVERFWRDADDVLAPALWEAELANVIWMSVRTGVIAPDEGPLKLGFAARLGIHSVATRTLWHGALLRALQTDVAVYDTLFVELAERERAPLVTFDKHLLKACPTVAVRPRSLK